MKKFISKIILTVLVGFVWLIIVRSALNEPLITCVLQILIFAFLFKYFTKAAIECWVGKKFFHKIKNFISSISVGFTLIIISIIYYNID